MASYQAREGRKARRAPRKPIYAFAWVLRSWASKETHLVYVLLALWSVKGRHEDMPARGQGVARRGQAPRYLQDIGGLTRVTSRTLAASTVAGQASHKQVI